MRYKGYLLKPEIGLRIVAHKPVRVYRRGYYIGLYCDLTAVKTKIDYVLNKYRGLKNGQTI